MTEKAIVIFIKSENPLLRYAVFHLIGLYANNKEFSIGLKEEIEKILLQSLDDPVSNVFSHVTAAIENFMEGIGNE